MSSLIEAHNRRTLFLRLIFQLFQEVEWCPGLDLKQSCIIYLSVIVELFLCYKSSAQTAHKKGFMIYVLRTVDRHHKYIKVGFVRSDIQDRIKSIQTGCPFRLELLAYKDGDMNEEQHLHSLLFKHAMHGEWFRYNDETIQILKQNGLDIKLKFGIKIPRGKMSIKKHVNEYFSHRDYPLNPLPHILESYCNERGFPVGDVESMANEKSSFFIIETSIAEIYEKFGYMFKETETDKIQKFIMPKFIINMHKIHDLSSIISRQMALSKSPE